MSRTTTGDVATIEPTLDKETLMKLQALVRRLPTSPDVHRYAVRLARATRPGASSLDAVNQYVSWGAGPRASQYLALGARVRAALYGHEVPSLEDVRAVAHGVLGHRVVRNFQAEAAGIDSRNIVDMILDEVNAS